MRAWGLSLVVGSIMLAVPVRAAITQVGTPQYGSSSNSTTLVVASPSGTAAGDLLVAVVTYDVDHWPSAAPAGWTNIAWQASGAVGMQVYTKCLSGAADANYTWTWSATQSRSGGMHALHGANCYVDQTALAYGSSTSIQAAGVTTTESGDMVLIFYGWGPSGPHTVTMPGGLDATAWNTSDASAWGSASGYKLIASPSATGVFAGTLSAAVGNAGVTVALFSDAVNTPTSTPAATATPTRTPTRTPSITPTSAASPTPTPTPPYPTQPPLPTRLPSWTVTPTNTAGGPPTNTPTVTPSPCGDSIVTTTADSGAGSFRTAAACCGAATITFSLPDPSTITLASPVTFHHACTVQGPGQSSLTIDGGGTVELLKHWGPGALAINDVTLRHSPTVLESSTDVTLTRVTMSDNTSANLATGIIMYAGALDIEASTFANNTQTVNPSTYPHGSVLTYHALALTAVPTASVLVQDSTFTSNVGHGYGVLELEVPTTIRRSTFSANAGRYAGCIVFNDYNEADGPDYSVEDSTFTGNTATDAIFPHGCMQMWNVSNVRVYLNNVTIDNTNTPEGIGQTANNSNPLFVSNSILGGCYQQGRAYPSIWSRGYNIDYGTSCLFNQIGDQQSVTVGLDALAGNGGLTQTRALQGGGSAVDSGNPAPPGSGTPGACTLSDQRGYARNGACDVGAYEYGGASPTAVPAGITYTPTRTPTPTLTPTRTFTRTPTITAGGATLTPTNTPTFTQTVAVANAGRFTSHSFLAGSSDFTIVAWIKPDNATDTSGVVIQSGTGTPSGSWAIGTVAAGTLTFAATGYTGANPLTGAFLSYDATDIANDRGVWIGYRYTGTEWTKWKNGVKAVINGTITFALPASLTDITTVGMATDSTTFFAGSIAEVSLWGIDLPDAVLTEMMGSPTKGVTADSWGHPASAGIAYWPLWGHGTVEPDYFALSTWPGANALAIVNSPSLAHPTMFGRQIQ